MSAPTTQHALASREQELRTLFELAQAFGRALDGEAILNRLGFALMGQLFVTRVVVALRDETPGGRLHGAHPNGLRVVLARGVAAAPDVPATFADLAAPQALGPDTALGRAGFAAAVPLRAGDVSRGVVLLGARASGAPLDAAGFDFAASLAALAVGALETAARVAERVAGERVAEEMRLARGIQQRLLPEALPAVRGLDAAARWRPSRTVSGDTYDVATLGRGRLLVAVADVVGKGIPAALLMATVQAGLRLLRAEIAEADDVGRALVAATARLDRLVAESTEPHQFVTLAWAVLDARASCVWSVAAGHPAPRIVRADGTIEALHSGGPLLGVLPDPSFDCAETSFRPGDALVVFSDGLTEALRADGEEWGEERLDACLAPAATAAALLDGLLAASDAFATSGAEADDLTLVAVRHAG